MSPEFAWGIGCIFVGCAALVFLMATDDLRRLKKQTKPLSTNARGSGNRSVNR